MSPAGGARLTVLLRRTGPGRQSTTGRAGGDGGQRARGGSTERVGGAGGAQGGGTGGAGPQLPQAGTLLQVPSSHCVPQPLTLEGVEPGRGGARAA